jgi:hypothetical protein
MPHHSWRADESSAFKADDSSVLHTKLPKCKRTCTPLCGSGGSRCKSSREHHFVKDSSVAGIERHLSCKQVHVGANLTGGSISKSLHIVTVAFLVVNEAVPVRIRLWEPFHIFVRMAKSSSQWFASPPNPVRVRGARPVSSDTREPANSLGLGPRQARGSTGVSDQFWSVA